MSATKAPTLENCPSESLAGISPEAFDQVSEEVKQKSGYAQCRIFGRSHKSPHPVPPALGVRPKYPRTPAYADSPPQGYSAADNTLPPPSPRPPAPLTHHAHASPSPPPLYLQPSRPRSSPLHSSPTPPH